MKEFCGTFILASLYLVPAAFAAPSLGQSATYSQISHYQGKILHYKVRDKITAWSKKDREAKIVERFTALDRGETGVYQFAWESLKSLRSEESYLDHCDKSEIPEAEFVRRERITVPAGEFETCHFFIRDQERSYDLYFGAVPFGIVKSTKTIFESPYDTVYARELTAFKPGKRAIE